MSSAAGPSTPTNKGTTSGHATSKTSATKRTSKIPADIREALTDYNIFVDAIELDSDNFESDLAQFIKAKVMSARNSPTISKAKHHEITSLYRQNESENEITLSHMLEDLIFTKPGIPHEVTQRLHRTEQTSFRPGSIPIPDASDDYTLASILKKAKIPENPEPDFLYGLKEVGVFSKSELKILKDIKEDTRTVPRLYFPFLSAEWKSESHSGNPHVARSQAARSGAAIVSDMRNFYAHVAPSGNPESFHPDLVARTACFSCIIAGWYIEVFVHWSRLNEDHVIEWHSTTLLQLPIKRYEDNFTELHKILHNIFAWGTIDRFIQIRDGLEILGKRAEAAGKGTAAGHKRKASASSP